MNFSVLSIIILCICGTAILCLLFVLGKDSKKKDEEERDNDIFLTAKSKKKISFAVHFYNMYEILCHVHFLNYYLDRLRIRYELIYPANERKAKESAMQTASVIWGIGVLAVLLVVLFHPSFFFFLCTCTAVFVFSAEYLSSNLAKLEDKLLRGFLDSLSLIQQHYIEHGMVDEAIYDVISSSESIVRPHLEKIYDVLTDEDVDSVVLRYSLNVPNQYLQQFVAICVPIIKFGDHKLEDGTSAFITAVRSLSYDIDERIRDSELTSFLFKSLTAVTVVPIFACPLLKVWISGMAEEFADFYNGGAAVIIVAIIYVITIYSYTRVVQLREPTKTDNGDHVIIKFLQSKTPLGTIVHNYGVKHFNKIRALQNMLKRIGSKMSAEQMIIKQICFSIVFFVASCAVLFGSTVTVKKRVISDYKSVANETNAAGEIESAAMMLQCYYYTTHGVHEDWLTKYKQNTGETVLFYNAAVKQYVSDCIMDELTNSDISISEEEAVPILQQYNSVYSDSSTLPITALGKKGDVLLAELEKSSVFTTSFNKILHTAERKDGLDSEELKKLVADSVAKKIIDYNRAVFHWYFLLIAGLIAFAVFRYPVYVLKRQTKDLQIVMEDEVIQFMAIIAVLRTIKRMSIDTILYWLNVFAKIFSDSIQTCVNNYPSDGVIALKQLRKSEPFSPLQRMVDTLIECDKINIYHAFSNIDTDRAMQQAKRKQDNEIRRRRNSETAQAVAMLPINAVVYGYVVIPFVAIVVSKLAVLMRVMSQY